MKEMLEEILLFYICKKNKYFFTLSIEIKYNITNLHIKKNRYIFFKLNVKINNNIIILVIKLKSTWQVDSGSRQLGALIDLHLKNI